CAADWEANNGEHTVIKTSWLPLATVRAVSDEGDVEMRRLAPKDGVDPLAAAWLASAGAQDLLAALGLLVEGYEAWIGAREADAKRLPDPAHRQQAETNLEVCSQAARRMRKGILLLKQNTKVRDAFQFAQRAMEMQRLWTVRGSLRWRPF